MCDEESNGLFFTLEFRSDPYPVHHVMRERQPVLTSNAYADTYVLTRFADCETILRDRPWSAANRFRRLPTAGEAEPTQALTMGSNGTRPMVFTDRPEHTRVTSSNAGTTTRR